MGNEKNRIVVLVGKSGAGKDTLAKLLQREMPDFRLGISTTSRPIRSEERDGRDYFFVSTEEFDRRLAQGKFWEHKVYIGYRGENLEAWKYGLEKDFNHLQEGNYILPLDLERAESLKSVFKKRLVIIHLDSPELVRRARAVARDKNFAENQWLKRMDDENKIFENIEEKADYIVKNDNLEVCLKQLKNICCWHSFN